jgi:hypothetical protein
MRAQVKALMAILVLGSAATLSAQKAPAAKATAKAAPPKVPAKAAAPAGYVPDLKLWRLEVSPDLGGWQADKSASLRIKLVDPRDPKPPKDEATSRYDYDEELNRNWRYREDEEPDTTSAADLKKARLEREAETKRNAWRQRSLKVWFNGSTLSWSARVGTTLNTELTAQNGENRLELLEPDSGLRLVRSWWVSTARTRLRVVSIQVRDEFVGGGLQVLEPDGNLAEGGRRTPSGGTLRWSGEYTHESPPPGTYTLKWTSGWRGAKPARIRVEAVLEGGTDQERRWTWERLILPGAGPVTLGTFDVEP